MTEDKQTGFNAQLEVWALVDSYLRDRYEHLGKVLVDFPYTFEEFKKAIEQELIRKMPSPLSTPLTPAAPPKA